MEGECLTLISQLKLHFSDTAFQWYSAEQLFWKSFQSSQNKNEDEHLSLIKLQA